MLTLGEVKEMGLAAARESAGPDAVRQVAVQAGVDEHDHPAYHFAFLIDQAAARQSPGKVQIDLWLRLLAALEAREDEHLPTLEILNQADWARRSVA